MAFGTNSDDSMISEINVTPMVDVILVLLVIFMIAAPAIYKSAIQVKLPKASTGEQPSKSAFAFTISEAGKLYWNEEEMEWSALEVKLGELSDGDKDRPISIAADEKAQHGQVIRLMDVLQKAGLTRFSLNVQKSN